ncbi:hypothetical protein HYH03_006542 [Edaphochlamys debaryana]|uniref:Plastid lipid-associated protein/fibrillin conserved domain-containing protein n=1 Tax=Edaphochlamys debaryana TaxID=47281 RepID=A0A835Y520_9CHLO|nr:hypothetical protein HYH03_006542 [Edaphochlamys debaryana]|eukprot:KAG2495269.1 hypothetical protein HYH03_006542 [Edaphochlamys debaryana]
MRVASCPSVHSVRCSPRAAPSQRARLAVVVPWASAAPATAPPAVEGALSVLRSAASKPGSVRPADVLAAMVAVEKAKLKPDGWEAKLTAANVRWRLIYTVPAKDITAAAKKQKGGSGSYFPMAACQKFDDTGFENGVFLGGLASLTFKGPFQQDGKVVHFDVPSMSIGVGPWRFTIPIKASKPFSELPKKDFKALPFFVYAYVGDDIVVARGRSGGVALWGRADAQWLAESGAMAVYK